MAITLLQAPRSPVLASDDNWVVFETDLAPGGTRPGFLVDGITADGDELNLRWGNAVLRLTFADDPDDSGTQLRAADGQNAEDFRAQLLEGLYSIPLIESDFLLEARANGIRMFLRNPLNGDLNATSSPSITVAIFGTPEGPTYPNLSAALSVYRTGDPEPIRLSSAYGTDRRTDFNLADLFELRLGRPPQLAIAVTPLYEHFEPEGWTEYVLRYADQYGRPPLAETLQKSNTYVVVAGGSGGNSLRRWSRSTVQLCHAYLTARDTFFAKPVLFDQPDWAYVYCHTPATVSPSVKVNYSDGSTETFSVPDSSPVNMQRGLYAWPSGPAQVRLDQSPSYATKTAVSYVFMLSSALKISYQLVRECYPWVVYLAYENGAGGIETVAMRGKEETSYQGNRSTFRRARTRVQSTDEAELASYNAEGQRKRRLRSGYVSKDYAEYLAQLTLGRLWIVDQVTLRLLPVNAAGSAITLTKVDDDLHAVELTVEYARLDRNAHRL